MTLRTTRRRKLALGSLLIAATVLVTLLAFAAAGRPPSGVFSWLADRPAPASWHRLALPDGSAVLSYQPALRPIAGDRDTVSAALRSPAGAYLLYLNSTQTPLRARAGRISGTGPGSGCGYLPLTTPRRTTKTTTPPGSSSAAGPDRALSTTT